MKTFKVWLEHTQKMRRLIHNFENSLELTKDALKSQTILISSIKPSKLELAISSLGITEEAKSRLMSFAEEHKERSLKDLMAQIRDDDIVLQDIDVSKPAILPQGTQPLPNPMQQNQQMQ